MTMHVKTLSDPSEGSVPALSPALGIGMEVDADLDAGAGAPERAARRRALARLPLGRLGAGLAARRSEGAEQSEGAERSEAAAPPEPASPSAALGGPALASPPPRSSVPRNPASRGPARRAGTRVGRRFYRDRAKRALDVALVLASAPVTVPLIALMALLVSLDGAAPFYRQSRLGRGGRVFGIWKMRTMVPEADAQLEAHLEADPDAAREWHATQKLRDDPRVTRIGRLLRKTSMDELPQFWNVLTGEMSLIGPRPMMVEQAELYPGRAYYALRPGITGPWQVSDRNDTTFAARAQYDQDYYEGLSLGGDATIFLRTFAVILLCTGR